MALRRLRMALWAAVGVAALAALALFSLDAGPRRGFASRVDPSVAEPRAAFVLTDRSGLSRNEADYAGRWLLVFFGFASCPDICPLGLATIARAMEELGPQAAKVQPLFITIDPARDDAAALADYVDAFHPRLVGLTGTQAEIDAALSSFRAYAERIEDPEAPGGYTMGHTTLIYLMRPDGAFETAYDHDEPVEALVADLLARLDP